MKFAFFLAISLVAATYNGCGSKPPDPKEQTAVVNAPSPEPTEEITVPPVDKAAAPCIPNTIYLYEDKSGSVDAAHRREIKKSLVAQLKRDPNACIGEIKVVQFGVRSVWSSPAQTFKIPIRPSCPAEPDYDQLPPAVRNFEPWREKLRKQHKSDCDAAARDFNRNYQEAVAAFESAFIAENQQQTNQCTSFGNLIERIRLDVTGDRSGRIVLISDLAWSCNESSPPPVHVPGILIQIVGEQQDDRYRYTADSAAKVSKTLPDCAVIPEVQVDQALSLVTSTPTQSSNLRAAR